MAAGKSPLTGHFSCGAVLSSNMVVPMRGRVLWLIVNSIYFLSGVLLGFVRQAEQLYGDVTIMSYNVHQLLHLADAAKDLGPL